MSRARWAYGFTSLLVCAVLVCLHEKWSAPERIDAFAYWCGAATLVALVVAVGEILHAGTASAAVRNALSLAARQQAKMLTIEVIALVDEASFKVSAAEYVAALRSLQMARRLVARMDARHALGSVEGEVVISLLSGAETALHDAAQSARAVPMGRKTRVGLTDALVRIKTMMENLERRGVIG